MGTWDQKPYLAVSRLPWLTALAAWRTDGTWSRGLHFTSQAEHYEKLGPPEVGEVGPLLKKFGLAPTRAQQFAVELRRGWSVYGRPCQGRTG